jgi:hypothetical protein
VAVSIVAILLAVPGTALIQAVAADPGPPGARRPGASARPLTRGAWALPDLRRVGPRCAVTADLSRAAQAEVLLQDCTRAVAWVERRLAAGSFRLASRTEVRVADGDPRLTGLAGLTVGELRAPEQTVFLDGAALDALRPVGRRAVLTHELVHVATRRAGGCAPLWLEEGLADHVAFAATGLDRQTLAAALLARVRTGWLPDRLPAAPAFRSQGAEQGPTEQGPTDPPGATAPDPVEAPGTAVTDPDQTYLQAWLAADTIARRGGSSDALVRVYRSMAVPCRADPDAALDRALRGRVGISGTAGLLEAWRADLRALAGVG